MIDLARREDIGAGDLTAGLLADPDEPARFELRVKQPGVVAGLAIVPAVLEAYDGRLAFVLGDLADGDAVSHPPAAAGAFTGPLGPLLSAERVALNFVQRLSGVATLTRAFVDAVAGTQAEIFDTRKTTPGFRLLEKYAVRCGGGHNHRFGLYDAVLLKDNHLAGVPAARLAACVFDLLNRLLDRQAVSFVEVEVDSLEQFTALLDVVGIDVILLDNFTPDQMREAVRLRNERGLAGRLALEASGGIMLPQVRAIAETGIDRISVGALTHSAAALDIALERVGL
ncbi:MAG: carboxylating nicotinate-nucleotide diphosphorylase [Phycisphaerales bacterium]|nr:MAG: carboxylating nicotinate-nucleotide diphosphorylase [Phycisphaerales bacterium]